ncbi:pex10 [Symbiodinium pilosum]|uniref:RING-type E3 ubiquitin transferase n=1 Tax=Symbiodinium pilosum TaxID=2952 RepID=A0A812SLN7_SYMPI|nr:pex10 [Symbiodinium pilosum]
MAGRHTGLPPPLPFAHPADLVRAHQKDEQCRGELRRLVLDAVDETLGRRAAAWQSTAGALADFAYALCTAVFAGSTLGEEYCELLSVSPGLQPSHWQRRLAATSLGAAWPSVEARLPRRLAALASSYVPIFLRLHLAMFYLFGKYRHVSDRCLSLRSVSMAERPYRSFSYRPLGVLLLAQVLGQVILIALERRRSSTVPADTAISMAGNWDTSSSLGRLSRGPGEAPLCNICMCAAEIPTVSRCMPLASPPWLLLASLSELAARESMEGCAGDFTATGADTLGKKFAKCAAALDAAGGHRSILPSTVAIGFALLVFLSVFSSKLGGVHEVLLHPAYLAVTRLVDQTKKTERQVPQHSCACHEGTGSLQLAADLRYRFLRVGVPQLCIKEANMFKGRISSVARGVSGVAECQRHLEFSTFVPACYGVVDMWRLLSDKTFFRATFGAQIRSLPYGSPGKDEAAVAQVALAHYRKCKAAGSMYVGVYFNAIDEEAMGYELGMCLPSMHLIWNAERETLARWWLASQMGSWHPELEIDAGSLKFAELAHRSEIPVDWAIVGLGRSGTTSLAAWLDTHPRLELLHDKEDSFQEGSFQYLFRRSNLEHLVRREDLSARLTKSSKRRLRILAGFKEPTLLQSDRGREILAEMNHVKILVIVKSWADWLKSHVLFAGGTACFPRTLAQLGNASLKHSCGFSFELGHVVPKMQDLESRGVAANRMKLVHLDALLEEGPSSLKRIAAFLGAGQANYSDWTPLQQRGRVVVNEADFWEEWCQLPEDMAGQLERRRDAATDGLAQMLRRNQEPVPPSLLQPESLQKYACSRAMELKTNCK